MSARIFWSVLAVAGLALAVQIALGPPAFGATLAALFAAGLLAAALGQLLARPVRKAARFAAGMARGDDPARLPETAGGSHGELYRALNRIAENYEAQKRQLSSEQAETETLLRNMGEGILALDASGKIVRSNPMLRGLIGSAEPISGKPPAAVFRNPKLIRFLTAGEGGNESRAGEFEVFDRTMLVTVRGLPDGGAVAVFSDLTPIKRLDAVRTEFVTNASHELKTPLTAIRGYAETLETDSMSEEERRRFLRRIADNADRMATIVQDMLTLARLETAGERPRTEAVSVLEVVQRVRDQLLDRAKVGGTTISVDVEPRELQVSGDAVSLSEIVENLVDNAIRHANAGRIGIEARPLDSGLVRITVWDDGRGIPTAHLDRVFERFYRVDASRSRATGGTGLGLAIVKHAAEAMGGRVWAESWLGEGARFELELPGTGAA